MKCIAISFLTLFITACSTDSSNPPTNPDTNWSTYLGDSARRHYSELTQITRDNVSQLEIAWSYNSGELREGSSTMYTSPLVVDGVLYGLSPRLIAFAVNAATGEEIWRHDPGVSGAPQRGLMWWQSGDDRRLIFAAGRELIALHAAYHRPGRSVP